MFIVLSAKSIPDHLRGYITRFLVQVDTGLFVGRTSRRVSDYLWERCKEARNDGSLVLVRSNSETEQGFSVESIGTEQRQCLNLDDLTMSLFTPRSNFDNLRE